ncbi:hypothetical protein GCE86_17925 [Micromonospora terminaliae]|uniref:Uncharacterized protein n=1 Tax=Micromonospora terminaliae TaxID=1914461 RepID=A0AAJ2ZGJ6_9ACTN|nr:hypothetical protein [Micromonospora terminaliae]NES29286.1 hypothetical protein [Micromonospora terminaliae]QGL48728.1 hypothetical protein GCE86_17925 [Micromonospora terminaliae]
MGIIALAAIAVAALVTYRAARPKRLLRWQSRVIPITDESLRQVGLGVTYNDERLQGALTAEVRLKNDCRKDFVSSDFEEGRPLEIKIDGRILNVLDWDFANSNAPRPILETDHSTGVITIAPFLFSAGSSISIRVLLADDKGATFRQYAVFSGHEIKVALPTVRLTSPIRDVAVAFNEPDRRRWVRPAVYSGAFGFVGFAAGALIGAIN